MLPRALHDPHRQARQPLPPRASAQGVAYRVGGLAAHAGQHVGVDVEGYGYGGVSEQLLNELGVNVLLEEERRLTASRQPDG